MIRLALRPVVLIACLFALALAAGHARPFDATSVELLVPSLGCSDAAPCFMGIRPGVTSIEHATEILEMHPWVSEVDSHLISQVSWTWSGAQPAYIDSSSPGMLIERNFSAVSMIRIKTHYNYGDMWLSLGTPLQGYAMRQPGGMLHGAYYAKYALLAINFMPCPEAVSDFWRVPVVIQFGDAYVMLDGHYLERSARYRTC